MAKLCRSVCRETRFLISAIWAAAWHARLSWRVVRGLTWLCPGNSQPCGRTAFHQGAQQREQMRRQHDVAVFAALALLDADDHVLTVDVADLQRDHFGGAQTRPYRPRSAPPCIPAPVPHESRATSSGLSTTGSLRGSWMNACAR